ncbi:hypothetical protein [Pseudomonas canadensis]|uniref:hypothetical protein n=1 Tax=Pseudomonas canadensis TaxID=915099 RepID=UPI002892BC2E|nr:hypothetical protein [Pseudomonas canadensis]WNJ87107.1 hypothetical protein RMQ99_11130 [Pseudomonas canadensis]
MDDSIAKGVGIAMGSNIAEVTAAIGIIVRALRAQPNFDSEAFNAHINKAIDTAPEQLKDGVALAILRAVL